MIEQGIDGAYQMSFALYKQTTFCPQQKAIHIQKHAE